MSTPLSQVGKAAIPEGAKKLSRLVPKPGAGLQTKLDDLTREQDNLNLLRTHKTKKVTKAVFTQGQRKRLARKGIAMPGGRYPIRNATDLRNAKWDANRTNAGADVQAHIAVREAALRKEGVIKAHDGGTAVVGRRQSDVAKVHDPAEAGVVGGGLLAGAGMGTWRAANQSAVRASSGLKRATQENFNAEEALARHKARVDALAGKRGVTRERGRQFMFDNNVHQARQGLGAAQARMKGAAITRRNGRIAGGLMLGAGALGALGSARAIERHRQESY
jgi:hypothetical protein